MPQVPLTLLWLASLLWLNLNLAGLQLGPLMGLVPAPWENGVTSSRDPHQSQTKAAACKSRETKGDEEVLDGKK